MLTNSAKSAATITFAAACEVHLLQFVHLLHFVDLLLFVQLVHNSARVLQAKGYVQPALIRVFEAKH